MSHISPRPEQSTSTEVVVLTNLASLSASGVGEFIRKTSSTEFENATPAGTTSFSLDDLTDVEIANPSDNQFLRYDGTEWKNESVSLSSFGSMTSAELAAMISNETGSGLLVFATSPSLTTPTIGAATGTSLQLSGLTASEILITDISKNIVSAAVATYPSLTELTYVKGVSSAIQTQLGLKAPLASPTFTGTVILPSGQALIAPALGTPVSGVLTNVTGLLVAGGGTGVATLTAYAPIFGGTTGTGAVQSGTTGTSGQVLTSNGSGALPTFQAVAGGTFNPRVMISTAFESSGRFQSANTGTGSTTYNLGGLIKTTGATAGSNSTTRFYIYNSTANFDLFDLDPELTVSCEAFITAPTDGEVWFGMGTIAEASTLNYANQHNMGFKIVRASSSTTTSASNSNGTTETATAFSYTTDQASVFRATKSGTTNITFYMDTVLQATHTTNLPFTAGSDAGGYERLSFIVNNRNVATTNECRWQFATLSWES